jgi:hypothetical protein
MAWFQRIVIGSLAIVGRFTRGGAAAACTPQPWASRKLRFAVGEPFPSRRSNSRLVVGRITQSEVLRSRSLMQENGVSFSAASRPIAGRSAGLQRPNASANHDPDRQADRRARTMPAIDLLTIGQANLKAERDGSRILIRHVFGAA